MVSRTKSAMVPIPEGSETHSEGSEWTDYVRVFQPLLLFDHCLFPFCSFQGYDDLGQRYEITD